MLLYIHIPFCDSKCHYCAFNSYVDKFEQKENYMSALIEQLHFELKRFNVKAGDITTLFIGGGTPSTVEPNLYAPIFKTIKPYLSNCIELTSEANPNSASKEWLQGMYELGINRISFGVQSFNDEKLKLLGRAHKAEDAIDAINNAKDIGFKNLSLDIIYATAGDTKELLENDLKEAFSLPINHLSAYALTIEENTPFEKKPKLSDEKLELTKWFFEKLKDNGFKQYEISNFGSYQSKHNLGYWKQKDYIGLGSGAVGFLKDKRFYPSTDIEKYIENPTKMQIENLTKEELLNEHIFLGLRSKVGVDYSLLNKEQQKRADILVKEKKILLKNSHLYNLDYLLSDEIALFIGN